MWCSAIFLFVKFDEKKNSSLRVFKTIIFSVNNEAQILFYDLLEV